MSANFRRIQIIDEASGSEEFIEQTYTGEPIKPSVRVYLDGVDGRLGEITSYTVSYENNVNVGTAKIVVTMNGRWEGTGEAEFEIVPADISTATVKVSEQVYKGTGLTPTPTVTWEGKQVAEEDYTLSYSDNVNVGEATVIVMGRHNFKEASQVSETFRIAKAPLTITANDQTYTYTGYQQGEGDPAYNDPAVIKAKVKADGLQGEDVITSIVLNGSQTDAGVYDKDTNGIVPSAAQIGVDGALTGNYDITYVHGTLTINKAPLTITAKDQAYIYNGSTQGEGDPAIEDNIDSKITAKGLQGDDRIAMIVIDGSRKDVGEEDITVTGCQVKNANNENVTENYGITYVPGTLTIKPKTVTVTTGSADKAYDGEALTNPEASIGGLADGETATVTATGSQTEVGSSKNSYSIDWGTTDKNNYTVTDKLGTLTVEEVPEYAVTFSNWDGTVLQSGNVAKGDMPKYEGADPTRPSDEKYTYAFSDWEPEVVAVTGDATYTARYAETPKPEYKVVSGAGGTWAEGSDAPLAFKVERTVDPKAAFAHFKGVEVDGKAVPEKDASGKANWTARSGSVVVELQPSYLSTLSVGRHTLAALFDDGNPASAEFTVKAAEKSNQGGTSLPKTSDPFEGSGKVVIGLVVAGVALAAVGVYLRRRKS